MKTICPNCNAEINESDLFCAQCGIKIEESTERKMPELKIRNNQTKFVRNSLIAALLALLLVLSTFPEHSPLHGMWLLTFIGIFIIISGLVVALIFNSRAKKLAGLISGEDVVISWKLDDELKKIYVDHYYNAEKAKNKLIFTITAILILLIFGIVTAFADEGKSALLIIMFSLIAILALFALGMPSYYRKRNLKGDGWVLIGKKFAYINGFLHNWDFPLSGLKKAKEIHKPFYGLYIEYYYTDRTFVNNESLMIPAPRELKIREIVPLLKK